MKPLALVVTSFLCGCAHGSLPPPVRYYDQGCVVRLPKSSAADEHGWAVYRGGHRVPGDELTRATADDPAVRDEIADAERLEKIAMGTALAGGVVFAPGIGLLGAGLDRNDTALTTSGAVLTAAGVATLAAGIGLWAHASERRERALVAYDRERRASCRP